MRITWFIVSLIVGVVAVPANVYAQAKTFYLDRLQVGGAPADGIAVWNPEVDGTRVFLQATFGVAYLPLRTEHLVRDEAHIAFFQGPPVTHQFITYATVGVEIGKRLMLSATLPMILSQNGLPTSRSELGYDDAVNIVPSTVYDMRIEGRVRLFENDDKSFRLGARAAAFLPTGDETSFAGDSSLWGQFGLAADVRGKRISSTLNLGLSLRPDAHVNAFSVGNEFNYALGVYVPFVAGRVRLGAELFGSVGLTEETRDSEKNAPLEFSLNIRYARGKKLRGWLGIGGGARLTDSYAPDFRIVGFVGLAIPPNAEQELNPPQIIDSDADGIPDELDMCPVAPEDGVRPGDGCPESKNKDTDRDGILNPVDGCPNEPEDKDDIDDEDGCPEDDADTDLVLDPVDKCPKEPGVTGGDPDREGCPQFVERVDTVIEIRQPIEFEFDNATIEKRSFPILQEMAQMLQKNKQIHLVSIEGHTDDTGTDEYNDKLSRARATAVLEHLARRGVDRNRLTAKWFGKTKPITNEASDEGHAKNRRVEFHIKP